MIANTPHVFWSPGYGLMLIAGFVLGGVLWTRRMRGKPELVVILAGGIVGLAIGGKLGYLFAEGAVISQSDNFLHQALVGKTVVGALLGGYAGVEISKRLIGHREATGDTFALAVPLGLVLGRIGCMMHGCCRGVACQSHWWAMPDGSDGYYYPAAISELIFNLLAALVLGLMLRQRRQTGQLFHLYLIAYGLFRFAHEFIRDTPTLFAHLSGYQWLALALIVLGGVRYRQRQLAPPHSITQAPLATP